VDVVKWTVGLCDSFNVKDKRIETMIKLLEAGADVNTNHGNLFLLAVQKKDERCLNVLLGRPVKEIRTDMLRFQEALRLLTETLDWPEQCLRFMEVMKEHV
jgi:hypothetical protein